MEDVVGKTVGRYKVSAKLGEGGMAVVYKAVDVLDREVALKLIRIDNFPAALLDEIFKRFEREARALAKFQHPNIVTILEYGEYEHTPFLVMEYLHGGTLRQQMGRPMKYVEAAAILKPIADALTYAHSKGIVHRDIKPENILFSEIGIPKVSDFGIARLLGMSETTQLTGTGMGIGTPAYMAPEQWNGQVTPLVDVYALGVVLYEMVTGSIPYQANTPPELYLKMMTTPLRDPRQLVPDLPEAVLTVLRQSVNSNPDSRYPTMADFGRALSDLVQGQPPLEVTRQVPLSAGLENHMDTGPTLSVSTPPPLGSNAAGAGTTGQGSTGPQSAPWAAYDSGVTINQPRNTPFPTPTRTGGAGADPGATINTPGNSAPVYYTPPTAQAVPAGLGAAARPKSKAWMWAVGLGVLLIAVLGTLGFFWGKQQQSKAAAQQTDAAVLAVQQTSSAAAETASAATAAAGTAEAAAQTQAAQTQAAQTAEAVLAATQTAAALTAAAPHVGSTKISEMDGMILAYIPAGTFRMGNDLEASMAVCEEHTANCRPTDFTREEPVHNVTLDQFWMDTTEVTNAMYQKCVAEGKCTPPTEPESDTREIRFGNPAYLNYPVVSVTWYQAESYCAWAGRRLPTEAEWEYAARGGLEGKQYPWGDEAPVCQKGAFNGAKFDDDLGCDDTDSEPVASYQANGYGLFDMAGNVLEWTADWFEEYSAEDAVNPTGAVNGEFRVIRSSSFYGSTMSYSFSRVSFRSYNTPDKQFTPLGFRCVVSP